MPAALRVSAITRPTAHMLLARSVVRAPSPGANHSPDAIRKHSVAWVCMISTWGSGLFSSMLKGSGFWISAATSAEETLVLFLMVPASQAMYFSPVPWP